MRKKIGEYLAHLEREGYARSTIWARRKMLALFAAAGFQVARFRKRLSRGRHLARQQLSQVRNFLLFVGRKKEAGEIRLPRTPRPPAKRPPSEEEVRAFLLSLEATTPISLRNRAIAELVYSSGLRACEVARLKTEDVDLEGRAVRVRGKGGRERVVPFGRAAGEWFARYLVQGRSRLNPGSEALFVAATGRALEVPGIRESLRPMKPHDLRRAAAAHCQRAGMNLREIQELLGHADLKNTARYTAFDRTELGAVLDRRHPRRRMKLSSKFPSTAPPPTDSIAASP